MKKIILLALTALVIAGCSLEGQDVSSVYNICVIDSCEYVVISGFSYPTHKGNCRFCKERRQRELEELVEQLKEK